MQTYELLVKERSVRPNSRDMTLVRTSVGIDQIHVLFDSDEWVGFPVTVTFAQGTDVITIPLTVSEVTNTDDWKLEATCLIPWEVIDSTGPIRVTFQGTDSSGRHIITAKGAPLAVEEAGDVASGVAPSETVTPGELDQAYAMAMEVINRAASLVGNLQSQIDDIVQAARTDIERIYGSGYGPATDSVLGLVKVGSGIGVTEDGTISVASSGSGMTDEQRDLLAMLAALANKTVSYTYSGGEVTDSAIRPECLPVATYDSAGVVYPDGTSVTVDGDGMLHALAGYVPTASYDTLGVVRPDGTTITIDDNGILRGTEQTKTATTRAAGKVKPDGTTITVDEDGTIHSHKTEPIDDQTIVELTPFDDIIPSGDTEAY